MTVVNNRMTIRLALFNFQGTIISQPNGASRFHTREWLHAKGERVASHDPPLALSQPRARGVLGALGAFR
jgi:hypothetical protein